MQRIAMETGCEGNETQSLASRVERSENARQRDAVQFEAEQSNMTQCNVRHETIQMHMNSWGILEGLPAV